MNHPHRHPHTLASSYLARLVQRLRREDRGSIIPFVLVISVAIILAIGLGVDGAGMVHAQQKARDDAAQAARAGGEQLNTSAAMQGDAAQVDPAVAVGAAQSYLAAAGTTGSAQIDGGVTLTVTTTASYHTRFLNIIGIDDLTVHGTSTAQLYRVQDGAPR